jgi:transcriptional regulator with XRE-family HTH domain
MSQPDLAEGTGINQTAISRYERGANSIPALSLAAISAALRTPLTSLVPELGDIESRVAKSRCVDRGQPGDRAASCILCAADALLAEPVAIWEQRPRSERLNLLSRTNGSLESMRDETN